MKNYKTIIIAGAIAIGLYFLLHSKKILPMTHPSQWRDMTPAQRKAYIRRTTLTTTAEKIKALKDARKLKAVDENTPTGETALTPEEQEAVLLGLEAEKEQGTGFDYIRERNPLTPAVPIEKRKGTSSTPPIKQKTTDERIAWTEKHLSPYKYSEEKVQDWVDSVNNFGTWKSVLNKKKTEAKKKPDKEKVQDGADNGNLFSNLKSLFIH